MDGAAREQRCAAAVLGTPQGVRTIAAQHCSCCNALLACLLACECAPTLLHAVAACVWRHAEVQHMTRQHPTVYAPLPGILSPSWPNLTWHAAARWHCWRCGVLLQPHQLRHRHAARTVPCRHPCRRASRDPRCCCPLLPAAAHAEQPGRSGIDGDSASRVHLMHDWLWKHVRRSVRCWRCCVTG